MRRRNTLGTVADRDVAPYLADDNPLLAPSSNLPDARAAVQRAEIDPDAERHRRAILDFVDAHDDALDRSCREGHLTGSAVVIDPAGGRVVMLHHRKLDRWLQPGGHCDGNANLAAVALREAIEETGLDGLMIYPHVVDLDVHEVDPPDDDPHLHLDARFLVVAPDDTDPPGNHESHEVRWVDIDALDELGVDPGTVRMVARARAVHQEFTFFR